MLAVTRTRTYRAVVASKVTVADWPPAASKVCASAAVRSVKSEPLSLLWIFRVWLRAGQPSGRRSTTRSIRRDEPRSAWSHCGRSLLVLSQ